MARARNIKPGFFKNEDLAECSPWARLCFAGLWCLADRKGRLEDRPKRIKGELFPFDSIEVEPLLQELERWNFILRYEIDGLKAIQILRFSTHQSAHYSEKQSAIKPPQLPEFMNDEEDEFQENSKKKGGMKRGSQPPESLNPDLLNPESLNSEGFGDASPSAAPLDVGSSPGSNRKAAATGTRLPEGWTLPKAWGDWALSERPDLTDENVRSEAACFADYWHAKPGKDGRKTDWQATWRNWVRRSNARPHRTTGDWTEAAR